MPIHKPKKINKKWEQDFEHWINKGTSSSTRRAYSRDVDYFFKWIKKYCQTNMVFPVSVENVLQFSLFHISPDSPYPLKLTTIRRYLASLSVVHAEKGFVSPTKDPKVKILLRRAKSAKGEQSNKKLAITLALLDKLTNNCDNTLRGIRDKAILLVGFSSGGRRRAEISAFKVEDLKSVDEGYLITIAKSKTDQDAKGHTVPVYGEAAHALKMWLVKSGIRSGSLFRGIKSNNTFYNGISGRSINLIVKRHVEMVGLDPAPYGAHSLRAGFITEASRQGIPLSEAMMLSGHKSVSVALGYCRQSDVLTNRASWLLRSNE